MSALCSLTLEERRNNGDSGTSGWQDLTSGDISPGFDHDGRSRHRQRRRHLDGRKRQRTAVQVALPNLVDRIEFANVGVKLEYAHHVGERGPCGGTESRDVSDNDFRLRLRR